MPSPFQSRLIEKAVPAMRVEEGAGFEVFQSLPLPGLPEVDPFLLIHELGPHMLQPGEAKGAPDHPHRGFETVTYVVEGELEHRDSVGNHGRLRAGDAQWMTAGRGVIHSEMPSEELVREGGALHAFQFWVNLPARLKMSEPRYQDVAAARLPLVEIPGLDSRVRVIAGEYMGHRSPIQPSVPAMVLDFEVGSDSEMIHEIPEGWSAMVYVYKGSGSFGAELMRVAQQTLIVFGDSGDGIRVLNEPVSATLRFLLLAGEKIGEPVARYGPFVMNTAEEIQQAFADFKNGRF